MKTHLTNLLRFIANVASVMGAAVEVLSSNRDYTDLDEHLYAEPDGLPDTWTRVGRDGLTVAVFRHEADAELFTREINKKEMN